LLKADHNNTGSEVAFYNTAGGVTYRPLDELSDSDETDMDISGDEAEAAEGPSNKRARLAVKQSASDNNAPRWSNPDPYTALPPEMATQQGKRKDVVQLIRKARVSAKEVRTSLPAESADFISLDFDDSDVEDGSHDGSHDDEEHALTASTGPSAAPITDRAQPDLRLPAKPMPIKPAKSSQPFPDPTPSALGSRKRTHDDEIKMPHTALKKVIRIRASGGITQDWLPDPELDPTPWMTTLDHSQSASMAVW
jgi:non-canonical poly(A) RNA polymerase PAPD5/7